LTSTAAARALDLAASASIEAAITMLLACSAACGAMNPSFKVVPIRLGFERSEEPQGICRALGSSLWTKSTQIGHPEVRQ
jgi:hypothetical protein